MKGMRNNKFVLVTASVVLAFSLLLLCSCGSDNADSDTDASSGPVLYLTSNPGGIDYGEFNGDEGYPLASYEVNLIPGDLDKTVVEDLKADLPEEFKVMLITSDPEWADYNEAEANLMPEALVAAGLGCTDSVMIDGSDLSLLDNINDYGLIILLGGHVPTQNAFFKEIGLKEKLSDYNGVIMGISAGSMNMAGTVYTPPEEEGEMVDPNYERFIDGLGLTDINVLPHMEEMLVEVVDGKSTIDYAAIPDSEGHTFYGLNDGDYIVVRDGIPTLKADSSIVFKDGVQSEITPEEFAADFE